MVWYLDTSAFLKLVVAEAESSAIRVWVADHGPVWSSQLLRTEALRAATPLEIDEDLVENALEGLVTYDERMAHAANAASITSCRPPE